jgi:Cysteine rich repeat
MSVLSLASFPTRTLAALAVVTIAVPATSYAQTQPPLELRSEALALVQLCRADADRLCAGVVPGGGRVLACLKGQISQLSPGCAQAMPRAEALKNGAIAAGVLPK